MLDDFSRYILAWKLCTTMTAADVTETLRLGTPCGRASIRSPSRQRPRLLSDNGPSYLSAQLGAWLEGARHDPHPWPAVSSDDSRQNRALPPLLEENRILLEHYYLPGQLEARLAEFVSFYNNRRYALCHGWQLCYSWLGRTDSRCFADPIGDLSRRLRKIDHHWNILS